MPDTTTISETSILELEPQPAISVRVQQPMAELDLAKAFDRYLPATFQRAQELGAQMAGAPFGRYHRFGPDLVDVEIGIPVAAAPDGLPGAAPHRDHLAAPSDLTFVHVGSGGPTMAGERTATHDPGMDLLSFAPAITSLVIVPVALGVAINVLAGKPDNDASPTLFSPLVNPNPGCGPVVREVELAPFRFSEPNGLGGTIEAGRPGSVIGRPVSKPALA